MQLLDIAKIFIVAETAAAFALLFLLSIDKEMIFGFWGDIVFKEMRFNEYKDGGEPELKTPKWKKPFGACQTCTVTWFGIITTIIFVFSFKVFFIIACVSNAVLIFRKI